VPTCIPSVDDVVVEIVAEAPELTAAQRDRLAVMLRAVPIVRERAS